MSGAEQTLQRLRAGNRRFAAGRAEHPRQSPEARRALVSGQRPAALVRPCADSRVSPEIRFDQGLGDLFVVRTAAHALDEVIIGTLEYTVGHFGVPLVVVLGHGSCGAVTESCQGGAEHGAGCLPAVIEAIRPAVEEAEHLAGDRIDNAARIHTRRVVEQLRARGPVLSRLVAEGKLQLVGAFYDLAGGIGELL